MMPLARESGLAVLGLKRQTSQTHALIIPNIITRNEHQPMTVQAIIEQAPVEVQRRCFTDRTEANGSTLAALALRRLTRVDIYIDHLTCALLSLSFHSWQRLSNPSE